MLMLATMMLAMVSNGFAQEPVPAAGQEAPPVASPAAGSEPQQSTTAQSDQKQLITVPTGTKVVLSLANPIKPKAARRGDSVRAVTAFPVTVNEQVAIPEGVLVEGVVDKLVKKDRWGHPWVEVHFTRMVFPNGYVLPLEAESTEAKAKEATGDEAAGVVERAHENGPSAESAFEFQLPPQQPPTLPPMPKPNYGPVIGLGVAGAAAAVAIAVIAAHHRYDEFFYNVGWQFDMVLQGPVQVDAADWNADAGQ
jgi:hypothetical protein